MPNLFFPSDVKSIKIGDLISVPKSKLNISHEPFLDMHIRLGLWSETDNCITAITSVQDILKDQILLMVKELVNLPYLPQIHVILGLCRPQMLKRILESMACFNVSRLIILKTENSPKSYLQSKVLLSENIENYLKVGSMQAGYSFRTEVIILKNFRDFLPVGRFDLPSVRFIAECSSELGIKESISKYNLNLKKGYTIAIGPESGWSLKELELLQKNDFKTLNLAPSILRVDIALISALSQCYANINY